MNKNDKRFQRTHAAMCENYKRLLLENKAGEITVSMLTEAAGVNRKTFYLHFDSMDDLLMELADEYISHIFALDSDWAGEAYTELNYRFLSYLMQNEALTRRIVCGKDFGPFFDKIREKIIEKALEKRTEEDNTIDDFFMKCMLEAKWSVGTSIFRRWLIEDPGLSLDELCVYINSVERGFAT